MLNTISVSPGDKVCVHAIKDLHQRGRALRIQAVLVTSGAIKDILWTGHDASNSNDYQHQLSDVKIKALIVKGLWRYSYLNLG